MNCATLILLAAVMAGPSQRGASASPPEALLKHCLVSLIDEVQVPAAESGPLVAIAVKEGSMVHTGDLLGQIDDSQPRLDKFAAEVERDAALTRAADDIEIRFAAASFDVADAELKTNLDINQRSPGSVPTTEIRRLRLARHRAELQIDRSQLDMKVAKLTASVQEASVLAADASVARRRIISPIEGVVASIYRHQGEWINSGEPVLHIVRMDQLRVEGFIDAAEFNPGEIDGRSVSVTIELARGRRVEFPGEVVFVSAQIQAGNKYRVRAKVANRKENGHWLLRPGGAAEMTIRLR